MKITIEDRVLETRSFSFPNGGHSIRKLANDLEELAGCVEMHIENTSQYDQESFEVSFRELRYTTTTRATGPELAKMLRARGTRFRCYDFTKYTARIGGVVDYSYTCQMDITTDVLDLMCNPDVYRA